MSSLSIIVLGYNQREKVTALLRSIEQQSRFPELWEVIYTDDGSTDGTIEHLQSLTFRFPLKLPDVVTHESRAAARNRGARLAQYEWLLFLDGDGELNRDFLAEILKLQRVNCVVQAVVGIHPAADCVARRYEVLRSPAQREWGNNLQGQHLQSLAFAIERSVFERIGGFDERFKGRSGEDLQLGFQLVAAGCEIVLARTATFHHNHPRTIRELVDVKEKYAAQGIPRMMESAPQIFRIARLHWLLRDDRKSVKWWAIPLIWWIRVAPLDLLCALVERLPFGWTGTTLIPMLAYTGTVRGYLRYLSSGVCGEEDAG